MHLDPLTLMVPEVIASAMSSLFVLGAWLRFRDATALLWWGAAHIAYTVGLGMLIAAFATRDTVIIPIAGAIMCTTPVLIWAGVRSFFGLPMRWPVVAGAPAMLSAARPSCHVVVDPDPEGCIRATARDRFRTP